MSRALPALLFLALGAVLALPEAASACASCVSGQTDQTRYAFIWTTALLSVLPLSMLGALLWWLRRRSQELARLEAQEAVRAPSLERRVS